jgi:molybdopterin converting factor small subunit
MSVNVKIPTPLRTLTSGQAEIAVDAATVAEALQKLNQEFGGLGDKIFDDEGQIRRFINVYVNEDNIRDRNNLATEVRPGDTISILPSIAGGQSASPGNT